MKVKNYFASFIAIFLFANTQAQTGWVQKSDYGGGLFEYGIAFTIDGKAFVGIGVSYVDYNDLWEYDPETDTWMQRADFPGVIRDGEAMAFSIGTKGYVGTGYLYDDEDVLDDFWEYDSEVNKWTQKIKFGGGKRDAAVGLSLNGLGYAGTGTDENVFAKSDWWQYNPANDSWTQKADYGGGAIAGGIAFTIEGKGYVGVGSGQFASSNVLWAYDPVLNSWTMMAEFPGAGRVAAVAFSIGNKAYVGTGKYNQYFSDFWEYDAVSDSWKQIADFGGGGRAGAIAFAIGDKGYVGTGEGNSYWITKDMWQYLPATCNVAEGTFADHITDHSAKLNWETVAGAVGYKIRYKVSGTNEWSKRTAAGSDKKINGLLPGTQYVWEVKTYCTIAPNESSDWSNKQYFTTLPARLGDEGDAAAFSISPNPFGSSAIVTFNLDTNAHVIIDLLDVSGKTIANVCNKTCMAGANSIQLLRNKLQAGVYLVQVKMNGQCFVRKVLIQ